MTALTALTTRLRRIWPVLDERTRRLVAANEATQPAIFPLLQRLMEPQER